MEQVQQLNNLTANPQFQNIRNQIVANPSGAQQILPQLLILVQQQFPGIMPIIQSNPQILMQLLANGSLNIQGYPPQNPEMGGGGVQPPTTQPGQQVPQPTIELTEDDRANIDTIMSMGFNEQQSIEAYMVCNKNVELAINYLFDSG